MTVEIIHESKGNSRSLDLQTYAVGIQKNRLDKTVLLSTQNIC